MLIRSLPSSLETSFVENLSERSRHLHRAMMAHIRPAPTTWTTFSRPICPPPGSPSRKMSASTRSARIVAPAEQTERISAWMVSLRATFPPPPPPDTASTSFARDPYAILNCLPTLVFDHLQGCVNLPCCRQGLYVLLFYGQFLTFFPGLGRNLYSIVGCKQIHQRCSACEPLGSAAQYQRHIFSRTATSHSLHSSTPTRQSASISRNPEPRRPSREAF